MSKPVLNKTYLTELYNEGLSIPKMVERIKSDKGFDVAENVLRQGMKNLGFDLKKKPKEKDILFVDDTANTSTFQAPSDFPEIEEEENYDAVENYSANGNDAFGNL